MEDLIRRNFTPRYLAGLAAIVIILGAFGYGGYKYYALTLAYQESLRQSSVSTFEYQAYVSDLRSQLEQEEGRVTDLTTSLEIEAGTANQLQQQTQQQSGTIAVLTKLTTIDPELLKKYSKVYFLNENYVPAGLTTVPVAYQNKNSKPAQVLTDAWPFLEQMLDDAKAQGVTIQIASGYRSFADQASLKEGYKIVYGAGTANSFSADQGYSEHQLGTTVDFTTPSLAGGLTGFDKTPAYAWLQANAWKYGFELSYPKGNAYYEYEPWHWRYVSEKLTEYLHMSTQNFYDLDQRTIDTYLVSFFDPLSAQ